MPRTVLVTGAGGVLGVPLVAALLEAGHRVRTLDLPSGVARRGLRPFAARTEQRWGSVADLGALRAAATGVDAAVHLAAMLPPGSERDPATAHAVNVAPLPVLLEELARASTPAPLVFPSSVTVYGPEARGRPLGPDDATRATDVYTRHKLEAEALLRQSGRPFVLFRVGVAIDVVRSPASTAVLRQLFELCAEHPVELLHPADAAIAMVRALDRPAAWGRVLPLGGGAACRTDVRGMLSLGVEAAGLGTLPAAAFGTAPYYTHWLDSSEAQALLDYQHHTLDSIRTEARHALRWVRPLARIAAPLVRPALLRLSRPWRER